MRIVNIVGARPNLVKLAPLDAEMRRQPELEPILVHTGQHYDANLSRVFFDELGLPRPAYDLGVGSGTQAEQTARVMLGLEPLLQQLRPELVLVVGDVNSTVAAALVAAKLGLPLAHVEAGLRSFDRTMPEEINRIVTDALADLLFTTERSAVENLRREGIADEKIFFVGNVMIDSLRRHVERARALRSPARYGYEAQEYAVLTLHRPSSVDHAEVLAGIVDALAALEQQLPILFPAHPRTRERLREFGLLARVQALARTTLLEPLGYLEFLGLIADARIVLTDSGGIQEETTVLGVPCLTLRENTERPVTIAEGTNELAGTAPERILDAAAHVLNGGKKSGGCPELWDGRAAERIVEVILQRAPVAA